MFFWLFACVLLVCDFWLAALRFFAVCGLFACSVGALPEPRWGCFVCLVDFFIDSVGASSELRRRSFWLSRSDMRRRILVPSKNEHQNAIWDATT